MIFIIGIFTGIASISICKSAHDIDRFLDCRYNKKGYRIMKKVYICSPSPFEAKNDIELDKNIEYSQNLVRKTIIQGYAPIAPYLYISQCLNIESLYERTIAMKTGLELLTTCDAILIGRDYGISEHMQNEIDKAKKAGIEVVEY